MKGKLLAILGLMFAMSVTACNDGGSVVSKESSQPQVSSASSKSAEQSSITPSSVVSSTQTTSSSAVVSSSSAISSSVHTHNYGTLNEGYLPSYYYDGMKPYYYCAECGQYFDADKNPTTEEALKLARATDNIAFTVDGNEKENFELVTKTDNEVIWQLKNRGITRNSVLGIAKPGDPTYKYQFFNGQNIDNSFRLLIDGQIDLTLVATPNGFQLSATENSGLVVRVNNTDYPLHKSEYYQSEMTTYIYGYHQFTAGDKMTVVDVNRNITYTYNDLANSVAWNKYDFHKGTNNEIVFDKTGRYGIEFDRDNDKKIVVTKTFAPATVGNVELVFNGDKSPISLTKQIVEVGTEAYNELAWYMFDRNVINADDIQTYLNDNGWDLYTCQASLSANDLFNLRSIEPEYVIKGEHLVDVNAALDSVELSGDYIKIKKSGNYTIGYSPCCDGIFIYGSQTVASSAYAMLNSSGTFTNLTADANGVVTIQDHFEVGGSVAYMDTSFKLITPTFSSSTDTTVARISSGIVFFDKAGTFKLELNLNTKVLNIIVIELDQVTPPTELTGATMSGSGSFYANMTTNPENSNELIKLNATLKASNSGTVYVAFYYPNTTDAIEGITLSEDSASIAASVSTLFYLTAGPGTYNFYLNKTTRVLRIEKVA